MRRQVLLLLAASSHFLWGCATYDLTLASSLDRSMSGNVYFGEYMFPGGASTGGSMSNVNASVRIPDTAQVYWGVEGETPPLDPRYFHTDEAGNRIYRGPDVRDSVHDVRVPIDLPWRWPWQKYHLVFTIHPGDSVDLRIDVLRRSDCRHLENQGKIAYLGSGPCAW